MKEFTEENILSLPPMCDSPAGDNSVLMKGMKTTQALACGTLDKSHPPHPNAGVIPESLKASCSALCCYDFHGGGVRKGAPKEVTSTLRKEGL